MPLSGPVIATVAILTFLPIWNAYLWPLMVVQSEAVRPVMVGLQYFFKVAGGGGGGGGVAWGEIMAYLSMVTLPILILYLLLQRQFVETIASSGVKG
jgi:multiple sugar transport system permease protein